ncbi:hypothetical protein TPHV1_120044 [Treponema phagedenis]|uniref:Uncharacterized protein n=1 Tax=Treponema phagedenis TaxID=162 RepID=A0A0B7GVB9_TREPH|nr:hypothetical protein TPHV1_120044 [Treponema phagedenis]
MARWRSTTELFPQNLSGTREAIGSVREEGLEPSRRSTRS